MEKVMEDEVTDDVKHLGRGACGFQNGHLILSHAKKNQNCHEHSTL
jgi:hypothetical protein